MFLFCLSMPIFRPLRSGRKAQALSTVGDRVRPKILEARQCFVGRFVAASLTMNAKDLVQHAA